MVNTALLRWIVLMPLFGVLFHTFVAPRLSRQSSSLVGPGVVGVAFALALVAFWRLWALEEGGALVDRMFSWIAVGHVQVAAGLRFDALSAVMTLIVTGVGFLIHVYSTGYMEHDEDSVRFFVYLNLFMLAMLLLVLGDSILLFFVGWEGVGLCSYLLIGFWY